MNGIKRGGKMEELKIGVLGLGYVGLPIAISFAKKVPVIGFDINKEKIKQYQNGCDPTQEVGDDVIQKSSLKFTFSKEDLADCNFHIVAVPTPLDENDLPDLRPLKSASKILGSIIKKGDYIVYESTVFPGVTEDVCIPVLEKESGMVCGKDFKVGYSPERINPGDKINTLETIVKVVSGCDETSLNKIAKVYELVVEAGVYRASSIKIAEASKIIENAQRDINIAFMNELSKIFNLLDINTFEVIEAAKTKWNFLPFTPGLVGGHCIGIDPYYLTYQAQQSGYYPEIILSGRKINDGMGKYIAERAIMKMVQTHIDMSKPKVLILGFTFKEDVSDIRNTRVIDIVDEFKRYNIDVLVHDPHADSKEVKAIYDLDLVSMDDLTDVDLIIVAVSHQEYLSLSAKDFKNIYKNDHRILMDVKGIFKNLKEEFDYWSL